MSTISANGTGIKGTSYRDIAIMLYKEFGSKSSLGTTIIGIWKDRAELEKWQTLTADIKSGIRTASIKTELLPMLEVPNKENVIVVGIGFGKRPDYSDLILIYHIVIQPKIKPAE
jgi:hypothetical protein